MLQGVKAAFAESFERIHRSNLIGMGILPLQFEEGESIETLGLDGTETFTIARIDFSKGLPRPAHVPVVATKSSGDEVSFTMVVRIDTPTEGTYYQNGGILPIRFTLSCSGVSRYVDKLIAIIPFSHCFLIAIK